LGTEEVAKRRISENGRVEGKRRGGEKALGRGESWRLTIMGWEESRNYRPETFNGYGMEARS